MKRGILLILVFLIGISFIPAQDNETNTTETCPELPTSMWCPDETTLCPMTTDEQGCSVWDCDSCEETPPEPEPDVCATKIEISFDKSTYNVGDYCRFEVGVFDSQGNPIPNYVFYSRVYADRWESPDKKGTGSEGYFRTSGEIGELPSGITSVIFEVYTETIGACNSVRDTTEIEVISKEEPEPIPPEPEPRPEVCAARISISFDKNVYYIGEEFEVVMEVFDSQGNHIPNYPFDIQMYDYSNGVWNTFEDDRTDESGYAIHKEIMREGQPFKLGKNKFKVYTKEYLNCDSVEGITIIEIKGIGKKEEVCGIGVCVPEEVGEVEVIPEEKIFYKCNGCELETKCYPMGYRRSGEYCSDNYEFAEQLEKGECDNSFECKSNVCVSGECVGEGLIRKIIKWFKKLFGGDEDEEEPKEKQCSKLLIEKDIGDYEYNQSIYGSINEAQAPIISDEDEQIGTVKCCVALYLKDEKRGMAIVCPYNDRQYVENLIKQLPVLNKNFVLGEYKGHGAYQDGDISMVWAHDIYAIASGRAYEEGSSAFPEDIADAYLDKYPSDLEDIEIPEPAIIADECELAGAGEKNPCYLNLARETNDTSFCEKMIDSQALNKITCYIVVAVATNNSNLCEGLTDISDKDYCYRGVAREIKDASICEKITNSSIKDDCYIIVA